MEDLHMPDSSSLSSHRLEGCKQPTLSPDSQELGKPEGFLQVWSSVGRNLPLIFSSNESLKPQQRLGGARV